MVGVGDFVKATEKLDLVTENSVGLVKEVTNKYIKVFFIGIAECIKTGNGSIKVFDIEKTGKGFPVKICNICHMDTSKNSSLI